MTGLPFFEPSPVLEIVDLEFGYGAGPSVIDGCRLSVVGGEIHCVLGCSGGGKTTLLRLIAGLERAGRGTISIDGETMDGPGVHLPPERRPVGMVFQDFALFPNRTVRGNVMFGMGGVRRRERRSRADEQLDRVGILDLAARMPHTLSGGQQQRVAIARSMARRPRVMLLDESFSSLDVETRQEVRGGIASVLKDAGVATIMVTHDPSEAEAVGDRVSWLDACCRIREGTPDGACCPRP